MTKIILPSVWTEGARTEFEGGDGLLPEVISRFVADHPDYRRRLLGPDSQLLNYINICVDDEMVPRHERAAKVVAPGATVTIISAMAGG